MNMNAPTIKTVIDVNGNLNLTPLGMNSAI